MLTSILGAPPANAFSTHVGLTTVGLGPGGSDSFLRPAVLQAIIDQHDWMDAGFWASFPGTPRVGHDEKHFDDCEFDGGARFIRDHYALMPAALQSLRLFNEFPFGAATLFGRLLHPAQDFYSHSNWVELGFPLGDVESTTRVEVTQSDLVDISGARSSLAQPWYALNWGEVVRHDPLRGDILLGADDQWLISNSMHIGTGGLIGSPFVPVVYPYSDPNAEPTGRLLVTGHSTGEGECSVRMVGPGKDFEYEGPHHDSLNKDGPSTSNTVDPQVQLAKYRKAYALAALQTGYEWCRLVREAHSADRDGVLLAMWVRAGGNPHPAETPCRPHPPGPTPVTVTIDSIRVLDSGDSPDDAGEIQLAAVLYDDPEHFHRSVHVTNRTGRMSLSAGDFVPISQLPAPMTLCVPRDHGATFTLHGWDNDQALDTKYSLDFDSEDELLAGFRREFGSVLPTGPQVAESQDLRVTFRVTRNAGGPTPTLCADPEHKQ
jgi:hypothetical protein